MLLDNLHAHSYNRLDIFLFNILILRVVLFCLIVFTVLIFICYGIINRGYIMED